MRAWLLACLLTACVEPDDRRYYHCSLGASIDDAAPRYAEVTWHVTYGEMDVMAHEWFDACAVLEGEESCWVFCYTVR